MKNQYHIDVTPEEDALFRDYPQPKNPKISFGKTFWLVFGLHVVGIAAIATTCSALESKKQADFRTPVQEIPRDLTVAQTSHTPAQASAPTPIPQSVGMQSPLTDEKKYTHSYTVKSGDTIYSIAKRYKLNIERLLKINDIKDANKIAVGQTLKFM